MILFGDLETYCEVPINQGTDKYSREAEVMLFPYAIDDSPVHLWDLTDGSDMPYDLSEAIAFASLLVFHNSYFDRNVLQQNEPIFGRIHSSRFHCTMAQALAHSLPAGLDTLGVALNIPEELRKHGDGKRLVQLFCKPRPANSKIDRATAHTHPEEWVRFKGYGKNDVAAMRECYKRMPKRNFTGREFELWQLDQKINDRGFLTDVKLAEGAIAALTRKKDSMDSRVQELTDNEIRSATQRDKVLVHLLSEHGIALPNLQAKGTIIKLLSDDERIPEAARELLELRVQTAMASVSKFRALLKSIGPDNRLRGTLQFCGAGRTARWAGRKFQPQNLFRPTKALSTIKLFIQALYDGCLDLLTNDVPEACANVLRGLIIASPGKKLVVADLANIESRVLAWVAGAEDKLNDFRAQDEGGEDLYERAYADAFGLSLDEITKAMRQMGKPIELAHGFGGGVGSFVPMVATYGLNLEEIAVAIAGADIPKRIRNEANKMWGWAQKKNKTFGLPKEQYTACDIIKRQWREAPANAPIVQFWYDIEQAVRRAVVHPKESGVQHVGRVTVEMKKSWLIITLPSGRCLLYASPMITDHGSISYLGAASRRWKRMYTYGGKLAENITQAIARDILAEPMPKVEEAGYEIVMLVHDELVTETPDADSYGVDELCMWMTDHIDWAAGLPLAADGFEDYRYAKH